MNYKKISSGKVMKEYWSPCNSLLIGLGQDQPQHPAVHSGGISKGRVHGCGCWCKGSNLKKSCFHLDIVQKWP